MRKCERCGIDVSGRGRQYCRPCAVERKRDTNKAFWDRVAERRPLLTCCQCSATYPIRPGRSNLRAYCQVCALEIRHQQNLLRDRARNKGKSRDKARNRKNAKAYKLAHPEWNREHTALYKRRHPEKVRQWVNQRRAVLLQAPGRVTIGGFWEKCEQLGWLCSYCPVILTKKTATMDYVIPLSGGGSNDIVNIVPACRPCNARKGNRPVSAVHLRTTTDVSEAAGSIL